MVGFVYFMIVRFVRLPHLKVFIYALPPHGLWVGLYNFLKGILIKLFGWVMMFFIVLTAIYWVISKIKFKPIRKLLQKIPPFPTLKKFGIFDFIGGLFKVIFSTMPFHKRIIETGKVFGRYIERNTTEFMNLVGLQQKLRNIKTSIRNRTKSLTQFGSAQTTTEQKSREEMLQRNATLPRSPLFQNHQARKIDDEYKQCLEENMISPAPSLSTVEIQAINSRNVVNRIVCKARYLDSYLEELRN
jgi:hypothetical protein